MNEKPSRPAGVRRSRVAALIVCGLMLGSCLEQLELVPPPPVSCSNRRLNVAASLYEEAKDYLTSHFKERDHLSPLYAYYASVDAEELTRTIRFCDDFNDVAKERGANLIRAARVLRRVILLNMRDPDPMVMMHVLGGEYEEVFKSDIH
jgi:hypothetical protein